MGEQLENRPVVNLRDLSFSELAELERGIIDERKLRELQEAEEAKVNQVAWVYHEQMPGDRVNGAAVWSQPMAPVMGYPSGMMVWHEGTGWQNNLPGVNMSEPGVGAGWATWEENGSAPPLTPEDFPEDIPEPEIMLPEENPDPEFADGEVIEHIDIPEPGIVFPEENPDPEIVDGEVIEHIDTPEGN